MRLIDADALVRDLIDNRSFYPAIVKNAIQAAPTIEAEAEPVKHGRWEDYINIKGVVRCSECNDTYIYKEWLDEGKWHYCPNCGAKMDGETNG